MRRIVFPLLCALFTTAVAGAQTIYWKKDYIKDASGATIAVATPEPIDTQPPSPPTGAEYTGLGVTWVELSWSPSSDPGGSGLAGYKIYRGSLPVGVVPLSSNSFRDNTLQADVSYSYTIVAFDNAGNHSGPSNTVSFTTTSLSPPSSLSATPASSSQIDLSWVDTNQYESGYRIERTTPGGSFSEIATVGANVQSYSDAGLPAATTYVYRVRAYNNAALSGFSNEASATTDSGPPIPGNLWLSPSAIAQGEPYTITVSNGANMTLDVEYYFNGNGPYYASGWPTLDENGFHNVWYTSSTSPGVYTFARIKNTLGGPWVDVTSGANTVVVTATPSGFWLDPHQAINYIPEYSCVNVFASNAAYMNLDAVVSWPGGVDTFYGFVQLDANGQGQLCFYGAPMGVYEFLAIKNSENNYWVSVYDYVEVYGF